MDKSNVCVEGQLYQVQTRADLNKVLLVEGLHEVALGDVLYCLKSFQSGYFEFVLVRVLDAQSIALDTAVHVAADALGKPLHWDKSFDFDREAFEQGTSADATVYAEVAAFFKAMSLEDHLDRIRQAAPGRVLAGFQPDGTPLFTGNCAMVLANPGGEDPVLTLGVKEGQKLTKKRMRASLLMGARIVDDPGMEAFAPDMGLFVTSMLKNGTVVRFGHPQYASSMILGVSRRKLLGTHALVKKVVGKVTPVIHLTMFEPNGNKVDLAVPTWALSPTAVLN